MCNKFLQTFACGHSKSICITPCVHAIRSSQSAHLAVQQDDTITRSNSTVSSLAPATQENSESNFSRPQLSKHSPLSANAPTVPTSPTQVPAFRFVAPDTTSLSPLGSPVSPAFTNASSASAPPSRLPSLSPSPTMDEPEPKLCTYYIPRYLFTSKYPCLGCYSEPEWEGLRRAWMDNYRLGHPLDRAEDVEALSGVKDVRERGGGD